MQQHATVPGSKLPFCGCTPVIDHTRLQVEQLAGSSTEVGGAHAHRDTNALTCCC